jgi:predicted nuclease with TOPRIM domain
MFRNKELQEKVSELEELNTAQASTIEELNASIEASKGTSKELQENMALVNGQNETLQKELNDLKANQENIDAQIADQAVGLLAQAGHETIEAPEDDEQQASVKEQYLSMDPGKDRDAFFAANKSKLFSMLNG